MFVRGCGGAFFTVGLACRIRMGGALHCIRVGIRDV